MLASCSTDKEKTGIKKVSRSMYDAANDKGPVNASTLQDYF
jgi:hypothetical protein